MRRHLKILLAALLFAALVPLAGCMKSKAASRSVQPFLPAKTAKAKEGSPSTPEQDAIIRVLEADRAVVKGGFDKLEVDSQPSAFVKMMAGFDEHYEKTDTAGLPAEFKAARSRYWKAWGRLQETLTKFPDSFDDVEFMDAMGSLFRNERAKGRKLGGEVMDVVDLLNQVYVEMYTSAEGYGVEVSDL
jgi:hypothetical protein